MKPLISEQFRLTGWKEGYEGRKIPTLSFFSLARKPETIVGVTYDVV